MVAVPVAEGDLELKPTTWWARLLFFFPLALTQFLITISHTIINSGLARLPQPEISIAAYSVAKSVMHLAQNPSMMVRQVAVSLVTHKQSYAVVKRVLDILTLAMCVLLGILGWTPMGQWVLSDIMGLSGLTLEQSTWALRVFMFFPITSVTRNLYQGMAILGNNNVVVPIATSIRLATLLGLLAALIRWTQLPGALIGAIAFTVTMAVEAAILWLASRHTITELPQRKSAETPLTMSTVFRFYWPLMIAAMLGAATIPAVNGALARGERPEMQIAAFAIAWNLSFLVVSPANMMHQVALAFTKDDDKLSYKQTAFFALSIGMVLTITQAIMAFTPLAPVVLGSGVGASAHLLPPAIGCMQALVLLPLTRVWREYSWGVLMRKHLTGSISSARTINMLCCLGVLIAALLAGLGPAAVMAGWAIVAGEVVECCLLHYRLQRVWRMEGSAYLGRETIKHT